MTYTTEHKRRIKQALAETQRFIDKESPRDPNLRPTETQQLLDRYVAHKAKLEAMLNE